jgi:uncharacterized membrane protein
MKSIAKTLTCALLLFIVNLAAEDCAPESKPWREVASGSQSNIQESTRQVIQTEEEWLKWWEKHNTVEMGIDGKTAPMSPPVVDFEKETVLAATLGKRSTGGHTIRFTDIRRQDDLVTATLQIKSPGSDDLVTMALTSPFAFIAIPKHEGRVKFIDKAAK